MKIKLLVTLFFFLSPFRALTQETTTPLQNQFMKYSQARTKLIKNVVEDNKHITREQWTQLLQTQVPVNESSLREKQLEDIAEAQAKARLESKNIYNIEIDKFRKISAKVKKFCKEIPKGGMLHVHADGTLDRETVSDLLDQANPVIDGPQLLARVQDNGFDFYPQEKIYLQNLPVGSSFTELPFQEPLRELFFLPQQPYSHSFSRFMAFFFIKGIIYKGQMSYNEVTNKIYKDFLARAHENKVIYIEISDAQLRPQKSTLAKLKKLANLALNYNITLRWNISFYRNLPAKENEDKMKQWINFLQKNPTTLITGIDLIADESTHPALEKGQGIYAQALKAQQEGLINLRRTMPAGELGHKSNVRDALIMGAERIGHAINLWQDPVALEYARHLKLAIETNLVSNFRLRVVKNRQGDFCQSAICDADHPFLHFLRLGLPVSLSTDDEGLFETTMNNECEVAIRTSDIQYSEIRQLVLQSIETSFVSKNLKAKLLQDLSEKINIFEAYWLKEQNF